MNWDEIAGKWKQMRGEVKTRWGRLSDEELTEIEGRYDRFLGRIQELYGIGKDEAAHEIDAWYEWLSREGRLDPSEDSMVSNGANGHSRSGHTDASCAVGGIEGGIDSVCSRIRTNPLTAVAVAVGGGLLAGLVIGRR